MNRILATCALLLLASGVGATTWPYDEKADAAAEVQQALGAAHADHKQVLLVFGANWCEDCRALDKALQGTSRTLIQGKFDVVKIDVGNFDKNLELDARYGHPIKNGIPAVVVVDADNQVIYSTKGGRARQRAPHGRAGDLRFPPRQGGRKTR